MRYMYKLKSLYMRNLH